MSHEQKQSPHQPVSTTGLEGVEALLFDVFGTVVNWQDSVHQLLEKRVEIDQIDKGSIDLLAFTKQWRAGYMRRTREIASGAPGPTNVDELHRELLDDLLTRPEYRVLSNAWDSSARSEITLFWHQLQGWPDSAIGIERIGQLPSKVLKGTLSNGSARLLIDVAKHAHLDWDFIFSGDLLKSYKPNPKMYLGACELLGLPPSKVAMVAAHIYDCQFARSFGLKTIYVPRETEDHIEDVPGFKGRDTVKSIREGGEVDAVVRGLDEIPALLASSKRI